MIAREGRGGNKGMRTYHRNEEGWYERNWSLLHHIRNWVIWIGGWEKANGTGFELFRRNHKNRIRLKDPTPISLFGHRFTHYGNWWHIKLRRGYLAWSRQRIYISPDGTSTNAVAWWRGAPGDVISKSVKPDRQESAK